MICPSARTSATPIARNDRYAFVVMPDAPSWGDLTKEVPGRLRRETPPSPRESVRVRPGSPGLVELADRRHVLVVELEAEHVDVLPDPLGRRRLRENDVAELDVPAQHHLRGRPPVLPGQ